MKGQHIAKQDHSKLSLEKGSLETQLFEIDINERIISTEVETNSKLLNLADKRTELIEGRAERAQELAANNALPADAAESLLSEFLEARQSLLALKQELENKVYTADYYQQPNLNQDVTLQYNKDQT